MINVADSTAINIIAIIILLVKRFVKRICLFVLFNDAINTFIYLGNHYTQ